MSWRIAELSTEPAAPSLRRALRHKLCLETEISNAGDSVPVVMLDLSESGMMISTKAKLSVDEVIPVDLPEMGEVEARVAWKRMSLYGCVFLSPVTKAAISAALLKSDPRSAVR